MVLSVVAAAIVLAFQFDSMYSSSLSEPVYAAEPKKDFVTGGRGSWHRSGRHRHGKHLFHTRAPSQGAPVSKK